MAFISNGTCYVVTGNHTHSLPEIPSNEVLWIRTGQDDTACFVTRETLYLATPATYTEESQESNVRITHICVEERPIVEQMIDLSPTIASAQDDKNAGDYCYLTSSGNVCVVNPYDEVIETRDDIVCICSVTSQYLLLESDGSIAIMFNNKHMWVNVLDLPPALDLSTGITNMSSYVEHDDYYVSLWGDNRIVNLAIEDHIDRCQSYEEVIPPYTPKYVQSCNFKMLVLTTEGDIVTLHGTYPGYVSVVRVDSSSDLKWYGVRNDGSYDVITLDYIEPGLEEFSITMTNTDPISQSPSIKSVDS